MNESDLELVDIAAVLDACVLIPASLRDALLYPAVVGLYRPVWTEELLEEVTRNLPRLKRSTPITPQSAQNMVQNLKRAFPGALVTDHTPLIGSMTNNPKDRHILAAAVVSGAQTIVTINLKDFPRPSLAPFHIEVQHPDVFLSHLFELTPDRMRQAIMMHVEKLRNPPRSLDKVLETLAQHTPHFVSLLREDINH
jgi:predicted nucleic acid-binding protein